MKKEEQPIYYIMGIGTVILILISLLSTGCTVKRPPVATPQQQSSVATTPMLEPIVEPVALPVEPEPPQDPDVVKALQKYEKTKRFEDIKKPTVVKYAFQEERQYSLVCPQFGLLTIRLLPGEVLRDGGVGDHRWSAQDTSTGLNEETPVITIRRMPDAEPTDAVFITNANIYQFLLIPGGARGNQAATRQIIFWDPQAEMQRMKGKVKAEEERRKRLLASRYPKLSFEHIRAYDVGGDNVSWRPVKVLGDHERTIVELPAGTGARQPLLTVLEGGVETRPMYRTTPERNENGPTLVVDQPFNEARLKGEDGEVRIIRRGN